MFQSRLAVTIGLFNDAVENPTIIS